MDGASAGNGLPALMSQTTQQDEAHMEPRISTTSKPLMFNGVALTPEAIQQTRQHFADNAQACIAEAESGEVFVNDLTEYREWCTERATQALSGENDHTFTFRQHAYYLQTGESVALLP